MNLRNKLLLYILLAFPLSLFLFLFPKQNLKANTTISPLVQYQNKQFYSFTKKQYNFGNIYFQSIQKLIKKRNKIKPKNFINKINFEDKNFTSYSFPNNSWKTKISDKKEYRQPKGDGFITFDQLGEFFIWYPRLGSYVNFYDDTGSFLWQKRESRYLKVFNSSQNIIAVSGDQSRFGILDPSGKEILNVQGNLLVDYKLNYKKDSIISLCAVFLGGDLVYVNKKNSKVFKIIFNAQLKSVNCNFKTGKTIVHLLRENDNIQFDQILVIQPNFSNSNKQNSKLRYEVLATLQLPEVQPYTIPLCFLPKDYYFYLMKTNSSSQGEIRQINNPNIVTTLYFSDSPIAITNHRCITNSNTISLYNKSMLQIFDIYGKVYQKSLPISMVFYHEENLWVKSKHKIFAVSTKANVQ